MSRKEPIEIGIEGNLKLNPNGVFRGIVKKSGNGAAISFYKRFLGEEVIIIRVNKMKNKEKIKELTEEEEKRLADKWEEHEY